MHSTSPDFRLCFITFDTESVLQMPLTRIGDRLASIVYMYVIQYVCSGEGYHEVLLTVYVSCTRLLAFPFKDSCGWLSNLGKSKPSTGCIGTFYMLPFNYWTNIHIHVHVLIFFIEEFVLY